MHILTINKTLGSLLVLASTLAVAQAQTTILFNSLGGRPSGSDLISNVGPIGSSFSTASSPVDLVDISIKLGDGGTVGTGTTTVSLFSNNPVIGGPVPGALLDTIGTISDASLTSAAQDYDFLLGTPYALSPATRYWIVLSSTVTSTAQWSYTPNSSGVGVATEFFNNSSGTGPNSAGPYTLEVTAQSVPEPTSLALVGVGITLAGYVARRKSVAK